MFTHISFLCNKGQIGLNAQANEQNAAASADGGNASSSADAKYGDAMSIADGGDGGVAEVDQSSEQTSNQDQIIRRYC